MIEFRTKLDKSKFKKLSNFQFKRILLALILISIVVILCGVVNILQNDILIGILWLVFGIFYIPCIYLISKIFQKNFDINKRVAHPNADETYFFNSDNLTIIQTDGKDFNSKGIYKYKDLYKIYKTKTDYVIYFNKDYVKIVPINELVQGTCDELDKILSKQLNKKFIKKRFKL